ncbi:ROK family protein [Niallia nealsonii]|uniref:Transcriptional regulator n=1 Tax=Niallia nealsonii TaxID=115979 RepID=A0A2N0YYL7_9BACI|nr:ROK family protein [Niallia nealsonii]PKG22349.1 transcriptional regulator [Niallia nealsonii]
MDKYIAFDVGGTNVKHALLFEDSNIINNGKYKTDCTDLDAFLDAMVYTILTYKKQHDIKGIAISLPGYINPKTGYSESAGSIVALHNKNIKKMLEEKLAIPVSVENDGNCAAMAEKWNGNAVECNSFICMTIGTGIGGGIMINDSLLHGASFKGGEFGHMYIQTKDGLKGNLHKSASTSALIAAYRKVKQLDLSTKVEGEKIFKEAESNKEVQNIIQQWYKNISYGVFNLAVTFNPEKILIGGGISEREDLSYHINNHLQTIPYWEELKVPIEICKHKNNAGIIGALHHFLKVNETMIR